MSGRIKVLLGNQEYVAEAGEAIYFHSSEEHQIINDFDGPSELIMTVTKSYL